MHKSIAVVVPVHNEIGNLRPLANRVFDSLKDTLETKLVFVDDGSLDGSWNEMLNLCQENHSVISIRLSRNFGHQCAVLAGLEYAQNLDCELIAIIDADLQDPPEIIIDMIHMISFDVDVVYGKRTYRNGESFLKKMTATFFYRFFAWLVPFEVPLDVGDFRVFKAELIKTILTSKDSSPFLRGLFAHAGFPSASLSYTRQERLTGHTKYNYQKMFKLAFDAILGFSDRPFRIAMKYSLIALVSVALVAAYSLFYAVSSGASPGWLSTFALVSFFGILNVMLLSLIGRYLTLALSTIVSRPRWIIREIQE